jgi:hypothetical protein
MLLRRRCSWQSWRCRETRRCATAGESPRRVHRKSMRIITLRCTISSSPLIYQWTSSRELATICFLSEVINIAVVLMHHTSFMPRAYACRFKCIHFDSFRLYNMLRLLFASMSAHCEKCIHMRSHHPRMLADMHCLTLMCMHLRTLALCTHIYTCMVHVLCMLANL